jgi:hypothetical protein
MATIMYQLNWCVSSKGKYWHRLFNTYDEAIAYVNLVNLHDPFYSFNIEQIHIGD